MVLTGDMLNISEWVWQNCKTLFNRLNLIICRSPVTGILACVFMAKTWVRLLAYTTWGGPGKIWGQCYKSEFLELTCVLFLCFFFSCLLDLLSLHSYGFHCEHYLLKLVGFQWMKIYLLSKGIHLFLILLPTCVHVSNANLVHIFSVEEFIQTSNLGEFKRRLHLLLAFHGEISSGVCVGAYLRWGHYLVFKCLPCSANSSVQLLIMMFLFFHYCYFLSC